MTSGKQWFVHFGRLPARSLSLISVVWNDNDPEQRTNSELAFLPSGVTGMPDFCRVDGAARRTGQRLWCSRNFPQTSVMRLAVCSSSCLEPQNLVQAWFLGASAVSVFHCTGCRACSGVCGPVSQRSQLYVTTDYKAIPVGR